MKLLLADDDSFLLDMYASKFTEAGYDVVAVKDAAEALAALRKDSGFDGVVIDMVMPGLSGVELLETIKKEKLCGEKCRYVMLSNRGDGAGIRAAKKAGAAGYIIKAEAMPSEVVEKVIRLIHA